MASQSTNHILMIKPAIFYKNAETIESNHYQIDGDNEDIKIITIKAIKEFNDFKLELESNGISVLCFEGSKECPDHIFPNWFTTFSDKTMQILVCWLLIGERRKPQKLFLTCVRNMS